MGVGKCWSVDKTEEELANCDLMEMLAVTSV
jgi:hypothetical protein